MKKSDLLSILAIALSVIAIGRTYTMNSFSTLIEKLANDSSLTTVEKQELVLQAKQLEQTSSMVTSIIQPGSSVLKVDNAVINNANVDTAQINNAVIHSAVTGDGNVTLNSSGITFENGSGWLLFKDTGGNSSIFIGSDNLDNLVSKNGVAGKSIASQITMTNSDVEMMEFDEDPGQANRTRLMLTDSANGSRLILGGENGLIDLRTEGSSGGSTFMRMRETTATPPIPGSAADAYHMYMKGDKLIIQFNTGGTLHYFYLDMTATTNQSWIYSATAP